MKSIDFVNIFKGAGLTGGASSNTNTAAASLAAVAGLSNTNGVNMLAFQHLFAGSPLTTGLPASGLTNSVSGKFYIFYGKNYQGIHYGANVMCRILLYW